HPASASAGYIRGRRRRRGTTRQPPETSWDNQPRGQDLWRPPSSKAITRTNWSEADTLFWLYPLTTRILLMGKDLVAATLLGLIHCGISPIDQRRGRLVGLELRDPDRYRYGEVFAD